MKASDASVALTSTGTATIFTFQGFMQVAGLLVAIAGIVIGFLNWRENKRRNDLQERKDAQAANSKAKPGDSEDD